MKLYTNKTLPKLKESQCFMTFCDVFTGIILNLDGEYNTELNEYPILLFESFDEAKDLAKKKVSEFSYFECNIMDYNKNFIERITNPTPT